MDELRSERICYRSIWAKDTSPQPIVTQLIRSFHDERHNFLSVYFPAVSEIRETTVGDPQNGLRLDRALGELFSSYSRNFLANLVTEGHVRVDGVRCERGHP